MILFYEDEEYFLDDYIEKIKEGSFKILIYTNAVEFLEAAINNYSNIELFIIDLMVFGPGNEFNGRDTSEGSRSGLVLLDEIEIIEKEFPSIKPKKKIVFTNRKGQVFNEAKTDKRVNIAIRKSDVLPSEFVKIIQEVI